MTYKKFLPIVGFSLLLVGAGCKKETNQTNSYGSSTQLTNTEQTNQDNPSTNTSATTSVHWDNTADGWMAFGTPPDCSEPFTVTTPVDIQQVTGILYPGQSRPDYKPHGGFRFDRAANTSVDYHSPIDGEIIRGARYLTGGEIQYTFDIVHPCGIMARIGHLSVLTPKFQAIADTFPAAQEGDSRTTRVQPQVPVQAGELIATGMGLTKPNLNVFADFGLFDLRKKNEASKDPAYAAAHGPELEQHALCWFDNLTAADEAVARALPPGDPKAGKTSDYCK